MDIIAYFQSYRDYFWEWTTDEDVTDNTGYHEHNLISIPNAGAIAYRPYIIEVLRMLKDQGFPPFGALLLVLYAVQEGYVNQDGMFYYLKRVSHGGYEQQTGKDIESAIHFLEHLSQVESALKKGQNKINLLQTLFKDSHNQLSAVSSELIIKRFEKSPVIISQAAEKQELIQAVINRDIKTLALLHHQFPTTESIVNTVKGIAVIPELEDKVVEEEPVIETGKEFVKELIEEPKTFQVGSLVKRIWSGLKIPMRHLSPGEQPIGGISDMTNKGDFNRMLMSEFAHEEEVFMNRVANNEALYIQREIPPEENIFERVILIDISLKNWGIPKVLAFASAIAVIKHPKAHSECRVFVLGEYSIPVSLDTVEEVIGNQNAVSPVLNVSNALERFFEEEHTGRDLEVFFITSEENVQDHLMQKVIHENRDRLKFLVTTSADGELNFYKHHKGTRKHIQKIKLPLRELWAHPPKKNRISGEDGSGVKTAVPENYPLLFPTPKDRIETFLYEGEFYILSNKKQLLKTYLSDNYYNKNIYQDTSIQKGCEVITEHISVKPRGQFALARNRAGNYILAQYQPDKKSISRLDLKTGEYAELNLTGLDIPLNFSLIYFSKSFFLYGLQYDKIFRINLEGSLSAEGTDNSREIRKSVFKTEMELNKLKDKGTKILNNFTGIGINSAEKLVISKFALQFHSENEYRLEKNSVKIETEAHQDKNKFTFSDGSEVITDHRGMLTLISSNKSIPTFYMPSTRDGYIALATEKEFGGSEYYLPKKSKLKIREMEEMYFDYMQPFIKHIMEYGA